MSKKNIYVAMGSLAYAVAKADGVVQSEEKNAIRKMAEEVLLSEEVENDYIDSILAVMEGEHIGVEEAYRYALDVLESNRYEFDFYTSTKEKCIRFIEDVANAFQGTSTSESNLISRFKVDVEKFNN